MKTIRFLSLTAIFAISCTIFACSNDNDDSSSSSSGGNQEPVLSSSSAKGDRSSSSSEVVQQPSTGWDKTGTVELGGASNATLGSFLDVDANPFKIYKASEAAAAKDMIDLIFDGTNFLTPEGCVKTNNSLCGARMAGYDEDGVAELLDVSNISTITATSTPSDIASFIDSLDGEALSNLSAVKVTAKNGGKFLMGTEDNLVLIIVNDVSTSSATLSISKIAWED